MKNKEYYFLTTWKLKAELEDVWQAIYNSGQWPEWWDGVTEVKELNSGDDNGIGSIRSYTIQSPFIYSLKFMLTVTALENKSYIKGEVSGELQGTGDWTFDEQNGITTAICHWQVRTSVKWMNYAAFMLAPLFKFNHGLVMERGAKCLAKKLNARLLSCISVSVK